MRLLPSIIKASQYGDVRICEVSSVKPAKTPPSSISVEIAKREADEQHQAIVRDAVQKAKNIVEAAQNYSTNQLRESTMRVNEECAQMKIRSYEDGYREGFDKGKKEGVDLGYQEGYQNGLKQAEEEVLTRNKAESEAAKDEIGRILSAIEGEKEQILSKYENDLEGLSLQIAQKILRKKLEMDPLVIQDIIRNVLDTYRNQAWVKIQVSPYTSELLAKSDRKLIAALQEVSDNVKIVASPDMNDGDCVIDLPDCMIDAGVDTQLDQVKTALRV